MKFAQKIFSEMPSDDEIDARIIAEICSLAKDVSTFGKRKLELLDLDKRFPMKELIYDYIRLENSAIDCRLKRILNTLTNEYGFEFWTDNYSKNITMTWHKY